MYKRQFLLFLLFLSFSFKTHASWPYTPEIRDTLENAYNDIREAFEHNKDIKVSLACIYSIGTFLLLQKTMTITIPGVVASHPAATNLGPLSAAVATGITVYNNPSFFAHVTAVGVAGVALTSCILGYKGLPSIGKLIF